MRKNYSSVPSVKSLRILGTTRWTHDQMTTWPDDQMSKWPDDQMTIWPYDHIDQMTRWPDDQMIGWSDDQMIRWSDDQMIRWSDDQMTIWPGNSVTILTRWPDYHIHQMTISTKWPDDQMTILTRWPDDQMNRWQADQITILTRWPYWPNDNIDQMTRSPKSVTRVPKIVPDTRYNALQWWYMMIWPYWCIGTSSKTTVNHCLQTRHQSPQNWDVISHTRYMMIWPQAHWCREISIVYRDMPYPVGRAPKIWQVSLPSVAHATISAWRNFGCIGIN